MTYNQITYRKLTESDLNTFIHNGNFMQYKL